MSEIVVIVSLQAGEGRGDEVVKAFAEAIPPTHDEEGCLLYALNRDTKDPDHFVHVEKWRSQEDMDVHMQQPHLAALFTALGEPGLMAGGSPIQRFEAVPLGDPAKGAL